MDRSPLSTAPADPVPQRAIARIGIRLPGEQAEALMAAREPLDRLMAIVAAALSLGGPR
jgi:hypothetical protein